MPNQKVPQLPILTAITDADLFYVVDVSDTTDDPTGSSKQVTREELLTNISYLDFNTTATTTHAEGRVHWNNNLKTLEVDTENPNVQLEVGHDLVIRVNNQTGSVLSKGRAVYIDGQQGQRPTVTYATYTGDSTSAGVVGLVIDDINNNNNGYVLAFGLLEGIDTSAYSAGTPLYLYTGGTITDVKPQAPNHDVRIGKVINSNATVGSIFVTIQNGYEIEELHDVRITTPTTNDVLVYGSYNGTPLWVNTKTLTGLTYVQATTISATTYQNLPVDPNYYTTAFTYSNNVFTIKQTGVSDLTAVINTVTGWTVNGNLTVTGDTSLQGVTATTATISGSGQNILTVIGSGNSTSSPLFKVVGSQGELFSVTDSLTGLLQSVNNISGLPIWQVYSDNTILMGNYQAPSLNTTVRTSLTAGTNTVYSIPTSAYTGGFFDYTVISSGATGARAGTVMSIWSGITAEYTDVSTNDIGNTSGITFSVAVSGGNSVLSCSATTTGWTLKTIVRSI